MVPERAWIIPMEPSPPIEGGYPKQSAQKNRRSSPASVRSKRVAMPSQAYKSVEDTWISHIAIEAIAWRIGMRTALGVVSTQQRTHARILGLV